MDCAITPSSHFFASKCVMPPSPRSFMSASARSTELSTSSSVMATLKYPSASSRCTTVPVIAMSSDLSRKRSRSKSKSVTSWRSFSESLSEQSTTSPTATSRMPHEKSVVSIGLASGAYSVRICSSFPLRRTARSSTASASSSAVSASSTVRSHCATRPSTRMSIERSSGPSAASPSFGAAAPGCAVPSSSAATAASFASFTCAMRSSRVFSRSRCACSSSTHASSSASTHARSATRAFASSLRPAGFSSDSANSAESASASIARWCSSSSVSLPRLCFSSTASSDAFAFSSATLSASKSSRKRCSSFRSPIMRFAPAFSFSRSSFAWWWFLSIVRTLLSRWCRRSAAVLRLPAIASRRALCWRFTMASSRSTRARSASASSARTAATVRSM